MPQAPGETPARYAAQLRLQEAKQRLIRDRQKITIVANRLGSESEAAFSRAFKRIIGASPSQFRAIRTDRTSRKPN